MFLRSTSSQLFRATLGVILLGFGVTIARAHDSPEHVVEALTRRIQENGESSNLLVQRAVEHRALGNYNSAQRDLEKALALDPRMLPALAELSQVYLALRNSDAALHAVDKAIALITNSSDAASFHFVKAEICQQAGEFQRALEECERSFAGGGAQLEWYLLRSQLQAVLGKHHRRVQELEQGFNETGSGLLKNEWIEALIDAGRAKEALRQIEPELAESRWQSSWLIRRARARLDLGQKYAARRDLRAAIDEINQRLNIRHPDLTLLADRGRASALLEDRAAAENDLKAALQAGADDWVVAPLRTALDRKERGKSSARIAAQP